MNENLDGFSIHLSMNFIHVFDRKLLNDGDERWIRTFGLFRLPKKIHHVVYDDGQNGRWLFRLEITIDLGKEK